MANCITLNQTSYHGAGAIQSIPDEVKAHGLNKAFVCSDKESNRRIRRCKIRI